MKTMYYKTFNFIQHTGNMVDLDEFRRRLDLAQRDSLARQPEMVCTLEEPEIQEKSAFCPVVLTMSKARRRRICRERRAWMLDICASLAVVFMTLVFAVRMLL